MVLYKDVTVYSRLLVKHKDASPPLEEGVGGRETSETTTDDDDLSHCECIYNE